MTPIITNAVRAGCSVTCAYPDCTRDDKCRALETAARHAAEAMREEAANLMERENEEFRMAHAPLVRDVMARGQKRRADAIRAIPIEGEK